MQITHIMMSQFLIPTACFFTSVMQTVIHIIMAASLINSCTCYLCHTQAGVTALYFSSWKGHSAVVRLLLGAGARDIPTKVALVYC